MRYHEFALCYKINMTENLTETLADMSNSNENEVKELACQMLEVLGSRSDCKTELTYQEVLED